mmetsp:Transcript_107714/g.343812  ORF Transcript_107714/g.343812 Transcript_107714/m.343812 type:complete len:207 (+) Transcript_107714:2803-3423(+)
MTRSLRQLAGLLCLGGHPWGPHSFRCRPLRSFLRGLSESCEICGSSYGGSRMNTRSRRWSFKRSIGRKLTGFFSSFKWPRSRPNRSTGYPTSARPLLPLHCPSALRWHSVRPRRRTSGGIRARQPTRNCTGRCLKWLWFSESRGSRRRSTRTRLPSSGRSASRGDWRRTACGAKCRTCSVSSMNRATTAGDHLRAYPRTRGSHGDD